MTSQTNKDIASLRIQYTKGGIRRADLSANPSSLFLRWFQDAQEANILEPNAMSLATVDSQGRPSLRTVLLKGIEDGRFVFFTNYKSRKALEIKENSQVSILFTWKEIERQVAIQGTTHRLPKSESESYFHSRPRESQIGAWVSKQSEVIPDRNWLEEREERYRTQFEGQKVPLPDFWGGFHLEPRSFEFWQGRPSRLHDRFFYTKKECGEWTADRLSP